MRQRKNSREGPAVFCWAREDYKFQSKISQLGKRIEFLDGTFNPKEPKTGKRIESGALPFWGLGSLPMAIGGFDRTVVYFRALGKTKDCLKRPGPGGGFFMLGKVFKERELYYGKTEKFYFHIT